jgi:RNA polymerase sigma factor (sigma-70 family)
MADDRERFERLYRENFRAVLRFAAVRIDPERAKDVAAETFLVAWRRLDDVPVEARPWLLGIARRVIAGQFRTQSRREALASRLRSAHPDNTATDPAVALADRDEALAAFTTLGDRDREVLRLATWDELSAAEAADVLGVTKLAFTVRLHRARRRLERALEPELRASAPRKTRRHVDAHS